MSKLRTYLEEWDITLLNSDLDEIRDIVLEEAGFKWIPVSEGLPDGDTLVLVSMDRKSVFLGYVYGNEWRYEEDGEKMNGDVLAWMPLPKSYKP